MSSLWQRSATSVKWTTLAHSFSLVVLFGRSVVLARWLPIEVFGVYALANSILSTTGVFTKLGMGAAFLHRHTETVNEQHTASVHFTLKSITTTIWVIVLFCAVFWGTEAGTDLRMALVVLLVLSGISQIFFQTPELILTRRVVHRRLALIQFVDAFLGTIIVLALAWQGETLWALLATNFVTLFVRLFFFYFWQPVWRPHWQWHLPTVQYFLKFGSQNLVAGATLRALDQFDDLWTGFFLGSESLGLYSRAYKFATYPRQIIAIPVNKVVMGTYAELKGNRLRLSQAFFRTNALLIRSGFLAAGILMLIAPEFIRLILTEKWLPMLHTFQLMLFFTLLDPLKASTGNLFVAVGKPKQLTMIRLVQLAILTVGLFTLGTWFGINGVAVAVNAMLVVGIIILFWQAKTIVDFSVRQLFTVPVIALIVGFLFVWVVWMIFSVVAQPDWIRLFVKASTFSIGYGSILLTFEWHVIQPIIQSLLPHISVKGVK